MGLPKRLLSLMGKIIAFPLRACLDAGRRRPGPPPPVPPARKRPPVPPRPRVAPLAERIASARLAAAGFRRLAELANGPIHREKMLACAARRDAEADRLTIMERGHQQRPGGLFDQPPGQGGAQPS